MKMLSALFLLEHPVQWTKGYSLFQIDQKTSVAFAFCMNGSAVAAAAQLHKWKNNTSYFSSRYFHI